MMKIYIKPVIELIELRQEEKISATGSSCESQAIATGVPISQGSCAGCAL